MKRMIAALAAPVLGVVLLAAPATAQRNLVRENPSAELSAAARESFIFWFDDSVSPGAARSRAAALVAQGGGALEHVYTTALVGFSARMPQSAAERLLDSGDIAGFVGDGVVTLGQAAFARGGKPGKGGGTLPPQQTPWGIARVGGAADGTGLTVWIIDTGVELANPDLIVDTALSRSFVTRGPKAASPDDGHGHGTHVAGIVAAIDNDVGVVGVAAGARVVAVRVLDHTGSGLYSWVLAGVDYVAAQAAPGDVANMSLGGGAYDLLDAAVANAADMGILFSVAAGNSAADANLFSPARVEHPNVYTVSATNNEDVFATFSNYGGPTMAPVEYAAPGVNVLSLWPGNATVSLSGTSMAAPHVAGLLLFGPLEEMSQSKDCSQGCATGDPDGDGDPIAHAAHRVATQ